MLKILVSGVLGIENIDIKETFKAISSFILFISPNSIFKLKMTGLY